MIKLVRPNKWGFCFRMISVCGGHAIELSIV